MQHGDTTTKPSESFALTCSRDFPAWLAAMDSSVAFTTYQSGKLFLLGLRDDGSLSAFERSYPRAMGLAATAAGRALLLATEFQIFRFENVVPAGATDERGFDARFAPRASWVTGDLDAHDVAFGADGRPMFVNTLFGCIAAVSDTHSFRPLWQPPFLSRLVPEDRCHLNGMAAADGEPRYATAVSRSDVADGWRDRRSGGGVVIEVASGDVIADGLSMPHSPRLHDGRLWLLNSGTGELGSIDPASGRFEPVCFCPGYARGLAFVGHYAVVGLSVARENRTFAGLALDEALAARDTEARCGLVVVDLARGTIVHWVRIEGVVRELYDVAVLPGIRRPAAIGFKTDEIKLTFTIEP